MKRVLMAAMVALVVGALGGCDDKPETSGVPAATRMKLPHDETAYTEPATKDADPDSLYWELSKDEPQSLGTEGGGYKIRANGMIFTDVSGGRGEPVEVGQTVDLKYSLTHPDKRPIENNTADPKAQPYRFVFGQNVAALQFWHEAVRGMKKGGKRYVVIPPSLVKEDDRLAAMLKPEEPLVMEVELADIRGDSRAKIKKAAADSLAMATSAASTQTATGEGLKVEDLVVGTGDMAINGKHVSVHYTGCLTNGTEFDSSVGSGRPFVFVLGTHQVIQGWEQGLLGMRVGGKRKLTIPPELGYGNRPNAKIPANSTLVFEVELLKVTD